MLILSDRVKETSSTVGSGSVALNGAYGAFQSFNQGIGNGNETYYAIENNSRWEVGKGVYTSSSNSLSRDVVLNSSASGAKVNLEGISVVFCTLPASKATAKDSQGQVSLSGIIFSDSTVQTTAAVSTTTIVGISGTKAQFDTSVTDGNFLYIGDAPTSHAHGNITNAGAIGSTTDLPIVTTTSGVLTAGSFGTTAGTFAAGDDSRITGALSTSTAASTYLPLAGGTLTGDLKFTDATYDIGKSGATRPRDGFFSRNLTVGAQATVPYGDSTNPSILIGSTDTGIHGLNGVSKRIRFTIAGTLTAEYAAGAYVVGGTLQFGTIGSSANTGLVSPSSAVLEIRQIHANTTAQTLRLNNTYTSATSFETLQFKSVAAAAYQIGSAIGSAGGTNRDLSFGSWDTAGTFTSSFYTSSTYAGIQASKTFYIGSSSLISFEGLSSQAAPAIKFAYGGGSPANMYGGNNTLGVGINGFTRLLFSVSSTNFTGSPFTISNNAVATGAYTGFTFTGAAHTNQTASTEATMVNWNLAQTVQFATGALTTQRAMRIQAPTYSFVGASTITTASTLSISGPPVAGTNATITNAYALNVESGYVNVAGGVLTGGTSVNAPTSSTPLLGLGGDGSSHGWLSLRGNSSASFGRYGLFYDSVNDSTALFGYLGRTVTLGHMSFAGSYTPGWFFTANTLQQRSGTTAQSFQVYNTYTSSTSYECINIKGKAGGRFEIGPESGDAGGTLRGLTLGGYTAGSATITPWLTFTNTGAATFSGPIASTKAIYFTSEPIGTPAGTTQTLTLADGNHQTLALTSATGTVTATLTVPTGSSSGTIIVKQHASAAKDITWAVSAGTIKWMGTEPDWVADAIDSVRIVYWRYNGSVMYLASTEVAV